MIKQFAGWLYRIRKRARARTIRHTFSFSTVAIVALMAAVLASTESPYVRLETPQKTVVAGEQFVVNVYVGAQEPVNAVDISVQFPSEQVTVDGIDTGNSVISLWTEDPYVDGDAVVFRGGTFRRGFVDEHLLGRINFVANETGQARFIVNDRTLLAGDGSGSEVSGVTTEPIVVVAVGSDGELAADVELTFVTDIDNDGKVTLSDINRFIDAWRKKQWIYDFNGDQTMNFRDFAIILADSFFN